MNTLTKSPTNALTRIPGVAALLTLFTLLLLAAPNAEAQWRLTPYLWTTGVNADVALNGATVVDAHIPFGDLVKDVDQAAMLRLEYQRGRFGALIDLFYVGMSKKGSAVTLPNGTPGTLDAELDLTVLDATASYSLRPRGFGLAFVAGTRVVRDGTTLDLTLPASPTTTITQTTESSDVLVNGIVGLRFRRPLTSRLAMEAHGDVGTGEAELTWSGGSELTFALGSSRRYALHAGYKRLTVEFREEDSVQTGITMSGLVTGFRFAF